MGGPQSQSGCCGEEKNPVLPGIKQQSTMNVTNIIPLPLIIAANSQLVETEAEIAHS
jgi:hypothetical protein